MTSRKPSSDEQFDGIVHGTEDYLKELFDNHGYRIVDTNDLGAEEEEEE